MAGAAVPRAAAAARDRLSPALLLLAALPASGDVLEGRVVRVADGDTLTVLVGERPERVRLAGIDAPEKGQPFGERSKEGLSRLTFGKEVRVDWQKHDRYGRVVGKIWAPAPDAPCERSSCRRTLDVGLAQVTQGLAWHYKKYAPEQSEADRGRYASAKDEARARRAGLWAEPEPVPVPPWEWRRR
jgi:endonuclease YncB( thermonuclease family)